MHNMGDSEDSEIDVCSVDDEISSTNHAGLTLVAAETYVSNNHAYEEQLVPLTSDDLLTRSKQKTLQQGKARYSKNNQNTKKTNHREKTANDDANQTTANDKQKAQIRKHKLVENGHDKVADSFEEERFSSSSTLQNKAKHIYEKQTEPGFYGKDEEKAEDSDDELLDRGINERLNRFHFESDHLAIKNNSDYHALLQTLAVLEAQRTQAIKDLERLHVLKDDALADPLKFVKNLQENKLEEFPKRQVVASLPEINWVHYMMAYSGDKYIPQITTRKAVKTQEPDNIMADANEMDCWDESCMDGLSGDSLLKFKSKVDGKPATHKQKWSIEEQEKLEKLLLLYPPEEVEARRWEKIAKALGTRTPQQVSSRIQKYFLKLAKAKLPIPGRGPTGTVLNLCKKAKINPVSYKNSSFFPSWRPNVYMSENDKDDIGCTFIDDKQDYPISDEEEILPDELKQTPEYQELMQLKKLKKYRALKDENQSKPEFHKGFMCDGCKLDPIVGVRWHCMQCPPDQSTDFCNNCAHRPFNSAVHKEDHQVIPVHKPVESVLDNDYLAFEQKNRFKYNYLDPNFIPCR